MIAVVKFALVASLIVLFIIYRQNLDPQGIKTLLAQNSGWAPLLFIITCALRPVLFFLPSMGLTVIAGLLFGSLWGTLYVAIGGMLSTILGFYFARWLGRDTAYKLIRKNRFLSEIEMQSKKRGGYAILYMRLFNIPWDLVSYWAGLSGIGFRDFYIYSLIPLVPISFLYTYFGSRIFAPTSPGFIISGAAMITMSALPFVLERRNKKND
jgi:uncharacterized membrane protein YdjX (TVP38/TMEM64 family)